MIAMSGCSLGMTRDGVVNINITGSVIYGYILDEQCLNDTGNVHTEKATWLFWMCYYIW